MNGHTSPRSIRLAAKTDWWHSWPGLRILALNFVIFIAVSLWATTAPNPLNLALCALVTLTLILVATRIIYLQRAHKAEQQRIAAASQTA